MKHLKKSGLAIALVAVAFSCLAFTAAAKKGGNSIRHIRVFNNAVVSGTPVGVGTTSPGTIPVNIKGISYTVNVSSTTKIVRKYNGTADFSEIMNGDRLQIWGTIDASTPNTINATRVRDNSIQKLGASFQGTVADITNEHNSSPSPSFTVATKHRGVQTVNVLASFSLRTYKGTPKTVADLNVGDQIMVKGIWNNNADIIYNVYWIKIKRLATITLPTP